jgi:very-short-patch-repair endonuclease
VATAQQGVISRRQLLDAGWNGSAIDRRVAAGRLIVLFRGVYAVGHAAVTPRGWCRAALLAVGPDAVLSHRSAAYLWALLDPPDAVHVTVPRKLRSRPGLVIHHAALEPHDTAIRDGLPLTSAVRTLHDLRNDRLHGIARREAQIAGLIPPQTRGAVTALPTRSELERALLRIVDAAGLPRPLVNHRVHGHTLDFAWPAHRLVVETDGHHAHGDRDSFERDRARDADLAAHGWTVIRFTWRQLTRQPLRVAARLAAAITARAPGAPG